MEEVYDREESGIIVDMRGDKKSLLWCQSNGVRYYAGHPAVVFQSHWNEFTNFRSEICSSFNLIVISLHDFVHTGHLITQHTF